MKGIHWISLNTPKPTKRRVSIFSSKLEIKAIALFYQRPGIFLSMWTKSTIRNMDPRSMATQWPPRRQQPSGEHRGHNKGMLINTKWGFRCDPTRDWTNWRLFGLANQYGHVEQHDLEQSETIAKCSPRILQHNIIYRYTVPEENEATVIGDNPCRWEISPPLSVVGGGLKQSCKVALHLG